MTQISSSSKLQWNSKTGKTRRWNTSWKS